MAVSRTEHSNIRFRTIFRGTKRGANDARSRATSGHIQPLATWPNGTSGGTRHHPVTFRKCLLNNVPAFESRSGLCALAVGLARCNPRRQDASGRAAPAWPGSGWLSSAGTLGVRARAVSEAVRGPSVKTSGDDGLAWDQGQSLAFAAWRCCGQRPGLADLRRQPAPA